MKGKKGRNEEVKGGGGEAGLCEAKLHRLHSKVAQQEYKKQNPKGQIKELAARRGAGEDYTS